MQVPVMVSPRLLILLALCVLPVLVSAVRPIRRPFNLIGRVYCDTCRAGFETSASTYIHGAKIKVECRNRETLFPVYSAEAVTDRNGTYGVLVKEDHKNQICNVGLVSSPLTDCKAADPRRGSATVILTRNNGLISDLRFANSLGFLKEQPLSQCTQLLKGYLEDEDE